MLQGEPKTLYELKTTLHNGMIFDYLPKIPHRAWKVYTIIALHANWHNGQAHITYKTIQMLTGIKHKQSVSLSVKKLESLGLVKVEKRKARNRDGYEYGRVRNFYTLTFPALSEYRKPTSPE